jgi:hypothetical protein
MAEAGIRLGSKTKFGLRADARETMVADPVGMKTTRTSPVAAPIVAEGLTKRFGTVPGGRRPGSDVRRDAASQHHRRARRRGDSVRRGGGACGDPSWHTLSWGVAGLVLAAWTVPLMFAAIAVEGRRDLA